METPSCDNCKLRFMCKIYESLYLIEDDFMSISDFDEDVFLEMTTEIMETIPEHCKFFVQE